MKTITIIGGVSGVGKSSCLGAVKGSDPGCVIDGETCPDALQKVRDCMENGASFWIETNFLDLELGPILRQAKASGYAVQCWYIALSSREESLRRLKNREAHGGRPGNPDAVAWQFARRWELLNSLRPCMDSLRLFDNENGFRLVAKGDREGLHRVESFCPAWFAELETYLDAKA